MVYTVTSDTTPFQIHCTTAKSTHSTKSTANRNRFDKQLFHRGLTTLGGFRLYMHTWLVHVASALTVQTTVGPPNMVMIITVYMCIIKGWKDKETANLKPPVHRKLERALSPVGHKTATIPEKIFGMVSSLSRYRNTSCVAAPTLSQLARGRGGVRPSRG